jgi:PD-(D/E)XK nuclease superfamily
LELANVTDPTISVRQHFSAPKGPDDIFIRLRDGDGEHHVVIESKIDTTAWDGQLEKYDAEMDRRLSITRREKLKATIIYITRDSEQSKATSGNAHFVQTRWECFLQTLEAFCKTNSSWIVAQVRDFVLEQRIATPVQVLRRRGTLTSEVH